MLKTCLIVGLGSMLGGMLRFWVARITPPAAGCAFPTGTFVANVVGCLAIGVFYGLFDRGQLMNTQLKLFLTVGLCGGFTTFSTFMNENFQLVSRHDFMLAGLYTALSLLTGFSMLWLGQWLVKSI